MRSKMFKIAAALAAISLAMAACSFGNIANAPGLPSLSGAGPTEITGKFTYTNDIITTYYVEQAVALVDMYGFVKRDKEWLIPVGSQTLGFLQIDPKTKTGTYSLELPAQPTGQMVDVDNNGKSDKGVQVFAVTYWPNLTGGPYSEGDDPSKGWPTYLASIVTDSENQDEVVSGNLVVWAPDGNEQFPSGFGADKKLFTADDPEQKLPAGYSIVNLDSEPFKVSQPAKPSLALFEPKEAAIKDFSSESYTKAFDDMFNVIRTNYAFNGIQGKEPNWDKLYAELQPRVAAAEGKHDANAFYMALRDFTWAFKDGHVGLDGGDFAQQDFSNAVAGGYGFALRQLDDGRVIVIYVMDGGPAAKAGMKVGAEVTQFNGKPIDQAIAGAHSFSNQSSDFAIRYQQIRYLLATQVGTQAKVTFKNPGEAEAAATLTAIAEHNSFSRTSLYQNAPTDPLLPVDYKIITQGDAQIGYVSINSNYDDLNLVVRLFQRALQQFTDRKVAGLIVDLRYNSGGAPLGLAGFLDNKEIVMGQLEYYSDKTKQFEPEGEPEKVTPNVEQYRFNKMAVLVSPACFSACEIEAYGFSQVPGMMVVGQYPTAGVEAEVSRGQFKLPEGMSLQVPFGRFMLPDGSLFLEGQGVKPTVKVPIDEKTAVSSDDVVLNAAIAAILGQSAGQVAPPASQGTSQPLPAASGPPTMATTDESKSALQSGKPFLEDKATEKYQASDFAKPGILKYTVSLAPSDEVVWSYVWCATTQATLQKNFKSIKLKFVLDGKDVTTKVSTLDLPNNGQQCRVYFTALSNWPTGSHHLTTTATFANSINDGSADYDAGNYVLDFTVNVQ
ncbi:MAG: S41 family peptidase [Anaerolineae bacterium]